jgi:cell division protein FtsQ
MSRASASRRGLPGLAGLHAPTDRRFRRPDVRPERRRLVRVSWRVARWLGPVLVVAALALWLGRVLVASEWLQVQHIVIRGHARLSAAQVEDLVAGLRHENILGVALDEYQQRLLESPWIARAILSRVLPTTIDVDIVERTPMAIARLGRQLYLVDVAGVIIGEYGTDHRDVDLPIVDGLVTSPASRGPLVDADRVRLTGQLLHAFEDRPDLGRRLSQVDVSNARDAVVMLDDDPTWLHLGTERFVERLMTYLDLAPTLRERFDEIDAVDLRFDERVFVRGQSVGK